MKYIYIGTWQDKKNRLPGKILVFEENSEGKMKKLQEVILGESVSKVRIDSKRGLLFASLETREGSNGSCGGELCVYSIEKDGTLILKQSIPSLGAYPIDFALMEDSIAILNHGSTTGRICRTRRSPEGITETYWEYDEASLVLYERREGGEAGRFLDLYKFSGSGKVPFFQESASPHSVLYLSQTGSLLVPCRGTDETVLFCVENQSLVKKGVLKAKTGQGPRNAAAVKDGKDIYVVGEIEALVSHYRSAKKEPLQTEAAVTPGTASECSEDPCSFEYPHPSDIQISRDETKIYILTRSTDTLSVFQRDKNNGKIKLINEKRLPGKNPREMLIYKDEIYVVLMDSQIWIKFFEDQRGGVSEKAECVLQGIPAISTADLYEK